MPKTIYLPPDCEGSGISVTWTPSVQRISISGWYDQVVGIEGGHMTLRQFMDKLGITNADCAKAWKSKRITGA